ncbi:MAG TPA: hypothetical protein VNV15_03010 [Opitutaceae bacterium]|nr:hypothetical protein [Opitutaceae bacterium]
MIKNPVKISLLKVAICSVALGWGMAAHALADVHRYLYELSTKSGDYLYAGEIPAGAKPPTKCVDVATDGLGRVTRVVRQVNGKMTSETIYQFAADAKLPASFATVAANGETISQNRIQRNASGDRVRVDEFTGTGELTEYVIRTLGADNVEELTYTAIGKPKGDRVVQYYSPAGILVRRRHYASGGVYCEDEYGVNNGLERTDSTFYKSGLRRVARFTYDNFGESLCEDVYSQNSLWYGSCEYANDLPMVEKYKWPGGRTGELRYSYDDKRQLEKVDQYSNEQFVCVLKYDRFPTGAIKRTFALGAKGQVYAVYPDIEVNRVDQQGHPYDRPDFGAIYRQGLWWSGPLMSFGRADEDGVMP